MKNKTPKRTPEKIDSQAARLLALIKKRPGLCMEELAPKMRMTTRELVLPMARISKKLKRTGLKRGTRYTARAGR